VKPFFLRTGLPKTIHRKNQQKGPVMKLNSLPAAIAAVSRCVWPATRRAACLLLVVGAAFSAQGAGMQMLRGHVLPEFKALTPTGRLAATNRLNLAIGLPLRNPTALSNLLQQIYEPASPVPNFATTSRRRSSLRSLGPRSTIIRPSSLLPGPIACK
jgi:hypothetical protein